MRSRTAYLAILLSCLSAIAFFDYFSTSFRFTMTTYVRREFNLEFGSMAALTTWVYVGSFLAFIPRLLADVVGRRIMLWITTIGLCICPWWLSQASSATEYIVVLAVLAAVYKSDIWLLVISEESPSARRGLFAAIPAMIGMGGSILMAGMIRRMGDAPDGWRWIARFPIWGLLVCLPLLLFVRESRHFRELIRSDQRRWSPSFIFRPWRRTMRGRLLAMCALQMLLTGLATAGMLLVGSEYLRVSNRLDQAVVGRLVQWEVIASIVAAVCAGFVGDWIGRRWGIATFGVLFSLGLFSLANAPTGSKTVMIAYVVQSFAATAVNTTLRLTTLELFPSDCRATAAAWAELLMTVMAACVTWAIGQLTKGGSINQPIMTLSGMIAILAGGVLLALPLLWFLPETKGRSLEIA
ncbi:MAG: MFS transporter [Planctomycetota bacterium]